MQESVKEQEQNEMWCGDKIGNFLGGSANQLASLSSMTYLTDIEKKIFSFGLILLPPSLEQIFFLVVSVLLYFPLCLLPFS